MQINLSVNVSNPAAEPAANAAELPEDVSASAFFAQIDQIWKTTVQDESGEKPSEQPPSASGNDCMAGLPGLALIPGNPQQPLNMSLAGCAEEGISDPAESKAGAIPLPLGPKHPSAAGTADQRISLPGVFPNTDGERPENSVSSAETGKTPAAEGRPLPEFARAGASGVLKGADEAARPETKPDGKESQPQWLKSVEKSIETVQTGRQGRDNFRDPDQGGDYFRPADPGKSGTVSSLKLSAQGAAGAGREFMQQTTAEAGRLDTAPEQQRRMAAGTESGRASENGDTLTIPPLSDNSGLRANAPRAAVSGKADTGPQAAPENTDGGNSNAGQESPTRNSAMRNAAQAAPEASQNSGKFRTQFSESQHGAYPQMASGPARLAEPGAAGTSAPPEAASSPREFILQLSERIQVQLRDGKGEIRIQLKPDSLGHLEINAGNTAGGVVARIVAESARVKDYLESNLPLLLQSLQEQGLKVERIQVSVQDFGSQSASGHTAQSGHAGAGNAGRGTGRFSDAPEASSAGQPDELGVDPATWFALNPNSRFYTVA